MDSSQFLIEKIKDIVSGCVFQFHFMDSRPPWLSPGPYHALSIPFYGFRKGLRVTVMADCRLCLSIPFYGFLASTPYCTIVAMRAFQFHFMDSDGSCPGPASPACASCLSIPFYGFSAKIASASKIVMKLSIPFYGFEYDDVLFDVRKIKPFNSILWIRKQVMLRGRSRHWTLSIPFYGFVVYVD